MVLLCVALKGEAQPTLQMRFGTHGPSSIRYGDNELLANGQMELRQAHFFPVRSFPKSHRPMSR